MPLAKSMEVSEYVKLLSKKMDDKSLTIGVVGLGYVGLPTALAFHKSSFNVWGIDKSEDVINSLKNNKSHLFEGDNILIPNDSRWNITTSYENSIPNCDVVLICVPTPVDRNHMPDISMIRQSFKSISNTIINFQRITIILESTVQPGMTNLCLNEIISKKPALSNMINIAYCPERVSPGEINHGVSQVARVVGSNDLILTNLLAKLYKNITSGEIMAVSSIEVAEASKLVENTQRDIDIAFVNELSILMPKIGIDVEEVLSAADTKWNFHRHTPGIGVGGHCIPIDPHYYIQMAIKNNVISSLSPAARKLNSSMPNYVAGEIMDFCESVSSKILVLGYSYKPNIGDSRETPIKYLIEILINGGHDVVLWDPLVKKEEIPKNFNVLESPYEVNDLDCVVLATAHDQVLGINWESIKKNMHNPKIYDGRRCLDISTMVESGWSMRAIGLPLK